MFLAISFSKLPGIFIALNLDLNTPKSAQLSRKSPPAVKADIPRAIPVGT
jgi:hypothetical protein